jgi:hypothetical protein
VKISIEIVEIAALPDFSDFLTGPLQGEATDGILDY